jgi:hypothetical protein
VEEAKMLAGAEMDNLFWMNVARDVRDLLRLGRPEFALQKLDWAIEKDITACEIAARRQVAK